MDVGGSSGVGGETPLISNLNFKKNSYIVILFVPDWTVYLILLKPWDIPTVKGSVLTSFPSLVSSEVQVLQVFFQN